ncbi:MAG: hypothetical protein A2X01_08050 [Bacteroidetes bacterium GWF2_35_48]|nr:MAG: hypothetical protein A2X01_08050 [Bacteroidetes bacterium GWF2_35_48]
MANITLISDWKNNDFYVAAVKGKILSLFPQASIIDVSHQVDMFSIMQAAFLSKNSYSIFPKGSVHIVAVNHEGDTQRNSLAAFYDDHYFLSSDDGLLSLIFESEPQEIVKINNSSTNQEGVDTCLSFPEMTHLAYAAAMIAQGKQLSEIGEPVTEYTKLLSFLPQYDGNSITGNVVFIDTYKNIITNIPKSLFDQVGKGRRFEMMLQSYYYKIYKINKTYSETIDGELLALFNSLGMLEVAIKNGQASDMLNLTVNSSINIKFFS